MKFRTLACLLAVTASCAVLGACAKTAQSEPITSTPSTEEPAATPEVTLPPYEANVLTGEAKGDNYPEGQRITAVMVNNITQARPQRGLSDAQMLFEIKVEGGITRFMAVFNDYKDIKEIGPIRSGRDQFFRLILPWQALYVHEGQSVVMQQYALDYDYGTLNNNDGANGYRDYGRVNWAGQCYNNGTLALEHTMYTSGDNISKYITDNSVDMNRTYNSTFFNFVDYRQENNVRTLDAGPDAAYNDKYGDPVITDGQYVSVTHSDSYKTRFVYDDSTKTYKMQQYYSTDGAWRDTVDEGADNKQLEFTNVIALYTDIHVYPGHEAKDLQYVEYNWGGIGYYCYGGKCEKVYWQKGTPMECLRLYYLDENGQCSDNYLEINTGKSYVTFVDDDEIGNFAASSLDGVDLTKKDSATTEKTVVEDNAGTGDSLGMSTDDLTAAATGSGDASSTTTTTTDNTQAQSEATSSEQNQGSGSAAESTDTSGDTQASESTEVPDGATAIG
jgi:hypothetical protein